MGQLDLESFIICDDLDILVQLLLSGLETVLNEFLVLFVHLGECLELVLQLQDDLLVLGVYLLLLDVLLGDDLPAPRDLLTRGGDGPVLEFGDLLLVEGDGPFEQDEHVALGGGVHYLL